MSAHCVLKTALRALLTCAERPSRFSSSQSLASESHLRYGRTCTTGRSSSPWKMIERPSSQLRGSKSATMAASEPEKASVARVAVGQMTSVGDQEANFATCQRLALDAKEAGCCMLFLPECCSFIGRNQQEVCGPYPSQLTWLHRLESLQGVESPVLRSWPDIA